MADEMTRESSFSFLDFNADTLNMAQGSFVFNNENAPRYVLIRNVIPFFL